jgi:hypothetical protein
METISFAELEKTIHQYHLEESRSILKEILAATDEYIYEHRDERLFLLAGSDTRILNTVFGEVEYSRRAYKVGSRNGTANHIYLLDELLSIEAVGTFALATAQKVRELRDEKLSYREIRDRLKDIAGIVVSRQTVGNVLFGLEKHLERNCVK